MTESIDYFCCSCGLYYDVNLNRESIKNINCPNEDCKSHFTDDIKVIRVGTIKFKQLLRQHKAFFQDVVWSSKKYAAEEALHRYQEYKLRS